MYGWCGGLKTASAGPTSISRPEIEDGDAVGQVADDAEVVGDEEVGDALLGLQVGEQVEDRGLHGDVERGGRLVADDDARVARERPPDRHALLEPAGELHGPRAQEPLVEAHRRGDLTQALLALLAAGADELRQRAPDDPPDGEAPVERGVGVLEDGLERAYLLGLPRDHARCERLAV